jgi:hypothetical protein
MKNKFEIGSGHFKRDRLELPSEMIKLFEVNDDELAVILEDEDGRPYAAMITHDGYLYGHGFNAWYRTHMLTSSYNIQLEIVDVPQKRLRITVSPVENRQSEGLYLGLQWNMVGGVKTELGNSFYLPKSDLLTHAFICGATGSGKTIFAKALLEEALINNIPCIVIDFKGDLSSMKLIIDNDKPDILLPWVEGETVKEQSARAVSEMEEHIERLRSSGLDLNKARQFKEKAKIRIFTPRRARGIQIAFPAALGAPPDALDLAQRNAQEFNELVGAVTDAFIDRLYPRTLRSKIENERNFVFEIVKYSWRFEIDLSGIEGLKRLLHMIEKPPFEIIGGLPVSQYVDAENRRSRLLNKVNTLVSGPETQWFEGQPLSMALLRNCEDKIPLSIINLSELEQFEDRSFVVAQVAHTIYNWMRTQTGTSQPRLLLFIDEIGGGGGKQALFPSYPNECAAKWGLNYLLRQGRAFGVCCAFATQNPGDIDYRALSNCGTLAIGRLGTALDRSKVLEGMQVVGRDQKWINNFLIGATPGDFVIRDPKGQVEYIHSRWTLSYHKVIAPPELVRLTK